MLVGYTGEELEHIARKVTGYPGGWLRHFMQAYCDAEEEGRTVMEPALYWFIQRYSLEHLLEGPEQS